MNILNKEELQLRRLIYGQSGIIIVDGKAKRIIKQIELIKSSTTISGFIFRPHFANTKDLTAYTEKDWIAMMAQYSLSYGWSERFTNFTGLDAKGVLYQYFADVDTNPKFNSYQAVLISDAFQVEPIAYYIKVMNDILSSKTVLRKQQIEILKLMPVEFIEKAYKQTKITIKETEILVIKKLLDAGSEEFSFSDPDQIVRFVVNAFNIEEPIEGQLTKPILKNAKVKIPTRFKKKILRDIDHMGINGREKIAKNMQKYSQFWKRLYKQLAYASITKMTVRFPDAFTVRRYLYANTLSKPNTKLETIKAGGNYQYALFLEMKNPGQMLRNLLQYMRYLKGDVIARKVKTGTNAYSVASHFEKKQTERTVEIDALEAFRSLEFYEALLKTNTKLLWQVLTLVRDERLLEPRSVKIMNKTKVAYSTPVPGLNPKAIKIVKVKLKNAIKQIKREENSSLGSVYLDPSVKDYAVQFSGRSDTSISMSGEYMPSGTIKDLTEVMKGKNKLLRVGLAWRGTSSCDIDLSMNIDGRNAVYYGRPEMSNQDGEIVISSSGDVTSNGNDIFSTELIDIDIDLLKKENIKWMFNSAIMYSGQTFDKYEAYWFMSVIDRKDRVVNRRQLQIKLDEMDYATQITESNKGMMGLYFTFDKKQKVEVLNIPIKLSSGSNAERAEEAFQATMLDRPKTLTIGKALKMSINKVQFVDDIQFADLVISNQKPDDLKEGVAYLHPGVDAVELSELIF